MPLLSSIHKIPKITIADKEAMFALHCRYFTNVQRDAFLRDMSEKDWVIILRDECDIVGFSTLQLIPLSIGGIERIFLFSGDTVVDRTHWGDSTLAGCFGHFMLRLIDENPRTPLHWFLISKGYRTYRFLPVFFNRFYPAPESSLPPGYAHEILHAVAAHKFNGSYDRDAGIVRRAAHGDCLKPEMCEIPEGRMRDPFVRFFLGQNPSYSVGNELACIADISKSNFNRYAWRVIEHTRVTWDE